MENLGTKNALCLFVARSSTAMLVALALGGCSGGSSLGAPPAPPSSTLSKTSNDGSNPVTIASSASSYGASSTKSVAIAVAPTGTALPSPAFVNCTTSCSLTLKIGTGTYDFAIASYDAQNGAGNKLSYGKTTQKIMPNQTNSVAIALRAVVATVVLGSVTTFSGGTPSQTVAPLTAKDAAGNTIGGTDPYATAIALSSSDSSGAFSLSSGQLTSPSSTSTISYSGSVGASTNLVASVPGTTATATVAITPVSSTALTTSTTGVKYGVFARTSDNAPYGVFSSGNTLSTTKTQNILDIGAKWTRSPVSSYFVDQTRTGFGYVWGQPDVWFAWAKAHNIEGIPGIENGTLQTASGDLNTGYESATAFGTFCSALATHAAPLWFSNSTRHNYSIPGNEINASTTLWGSESKIASYMQSCYAAIKKADPVAFIWGLEATADAGANFRATPLVADLRALGCGPGTCYDGLSEHLILSASSNTVSNPTLPSPTAICSATTPGNYYSLQCLTDLENASGNANLPLMVGETGDTWGGPGTVMDAATKAYFEPLSLHALASHANVQYILHDNLDECALYPSGYFMNGCLVDLNNAHVPAWDAVSAVFHGG